jgi:hypothetical protein
VKGEKCCANNSPFAVRNQCWYHHHQAFQRREYSGLLLSIDSSSIGSHYSFIVRCMVEGESPQNTERTSSLLRDRRNNKALFNSLPPVVDPTKYDSVGPGATCHTKFLNIRPDSSLWYPHGKLRFFGWLLPQVPVLHLVHRL